jgi:ribonuclease VapC
MFVDTSAIVSVVLNEVTAREVEFLIESVQKVFASPVVRLETSVVLASKLGISVSDAEVIFEEFVKSSGIQIAPMSDEIGIIAVEAYNQFGKGRHPARLNLADCFSYAMAKSLDVPLLFVGNDFSKTDIKSAL